MLNQQPSNQLFGANKMNNLSVQTQQTMSSTQMSEQTMNHNLLPTKKTMLSTEIAALTGKQHKNVIRDIEVIIEQLEKDSSNLSFLAKSTGYIGSNGIRYKCYELDYESTMVVLTGYDVVARTKVIKRWQEFEQQVSKPIDLMQMLNNPVVIRNLLLTYAETVIEKDKVIAQQAPKVAALERLSELDGSLNVTETAKVLDVKPQNLFTWLMCNRWIYRRVGSANWLGYQDKTQRGYVTHKVQPILLADGTKRICEQVRITPKGLAKLATTFQSVAI